MSDDELEAFLDIAAYGTMDRQMATEELTRKLRSISKHLESDARFLGGCVANAICTLSRRSIGGADTPPTGPARLLIKLDDR